MSAETQQILEQLPFHRDVEIIKAHPSGLIALSKGAGVMSHPNKKGDERRSLLTCKWDAQRECFSHKGRDGRTYRFFLLHRLDSATSGIILGSIDPDLAKELKKQFSERSVSKTYYAVVGGMPRQKREVWKDRLVRQRSGSKVRSRGKGRFSLLELQLLTGRTHQLRVQCAERGLPILGDTTYGDFELNKAMKKAGFGRLCLHSHSISVDWRWQGKVQKFQVKCPLPSEFEKILQLA